MKLPIKKKYFDEIKSGKKDLDFRDAHITFICEETGEKIQRRVSEVFLCDVKDVELPIKELVTIFDDDVVIAFALKEDKIRRKCDTCGKITAGKFTFFRNKTFFKNEKHKKRIGRMCETCHNKLFPKIDFR